jgi:uncharacterized protein (TIGR02284 family)
MDTSTAISTLNDLIETCRDGENGFRTAAESLKDHYAKGIFERYGRQRAEMARELEQEVGRLGGTAATRGSTSGALHRGWMNIKSAVAGSDDAAIIAEAERGEDVAKSAYEKALASRTLPAGAHELVEQQAAIVRATHDEVRALEKGGAH